MTEQCPYCGSKSGVDVHGREFCHACKKDFNPGRKSIKIANPEIVRKQMEMPINTNSNLPEEAKQWLLKYFDERDLPLQYCFWSDKYQRLCFPTYYIGEYTLENERMEGCWMRDVFGRSKAKWLYVGDKKLNFVYCGTEIKEVVCLVEDVVSAIKVSKFVDTIALGGSSIDLSTLIPALNNYKKVLLWMDGDEAGKKANRKIYDELKILYSVKEIRTKKDPKEFSYQEIEELVL